MWMTPREITCSDAASPSRGPTSEIFRKRCSASTGGNWRHTLCPWSSRKEMLRRKGGHGEHSLHAFLLPRTRSEGVQGHDALRPARHALCHRSEERRVG